MVMVKEGIGLSAPGHFFAISPDINTFFPAEVYIIWRQAYLHTRVGKQKAKAEDRSDVLYISRRSCEKSRKGGWNSIAVP
jgi:hypothetical protein